MKAAVYTVYGSPKVIQIQEVDKPTPQPHEVLINIRASSITRADTMMRQGTPKFGRFFVGLFKPKNPALGTGFSGIVEAVGNQVTKFKIGDAVFGEKLFSNGTNAQYICVNQEGIIVSKPDHLSHEQAAPICDGFLTSYSFLKDIAKLQSGQHILVNGASGSLGTAAVQLAKYMGARVTGVCSAKNGTLVKSLGADKVIDYKETDFTTGGTRYDVVYDTVGKSSYKACKNIISDNGVFVTPVLSFETLRYSLFKPKQVKFSATGIRKQHVLKALLTELVPLFKQEKLQTVIDRTYRLEQLVEAHHYLETGRKVGNIVISQS
ncbi:Zn-dependent oxidoreductase [Mangrovimonas yunxiaonensis]|uniref:Zn-dependent oxidoreductase n=1 Tax=Mangrovimonas yunxiaonensis TaxID=1197477 RepID=A0A084THL8_9FLAO|nr:NAD(P)-dependent alcohol dehydrogenase [Mangrovimonas yunxiaonensis]KFB00204.1 Zn-dependent oxidoreductase [Mangrovimonas yunxiaonensis]GGH42514.1 alcohol dehydrogenase [Mangrovimonas yunxiaonensis]